MSGIFGLVDLDGAPIEPDELSEMASLLTRRGPDRTGIWHSGPVGLGHTLLATTPEAVIEQLPLVHSASGCVITADVRLDNRADLLATLGLRDRAALIGDAEIVLTAYLAWGEACVERLLGDFAFAIWDPRHARLFCARDHMGMRQLIYHHGARRSFVFATEPAAILVLPRTPYRINEARIADYLVYDLEGIDKTSTFFQGVLRLPPAHTLTVARDGARQRRYWKLEPASELRLVSDEAYAEAFLEVFTEAVRCRLRTVGPVGSMLSGGMDSGSVAAVARRLLAAENRGPLLTFSAVSPDGDADPETRAIRAASTMGGLEPAAVSSELGDLLPELEQLTWEIDEPFDGHMTLVRAVYLAAHRRGLRMLLDGVSGDVVLSEGRLLARLLRAGRLRTAYREASLRNRVWGGGYPPGRELARSARAAFVPDLILRHLRPLRPRARLARTIDDYMVDREFARRVDLGERMQLMARSRAVRPMVDGGVERARELDQPHISVATERYDRVAAAVAVEPRRSFLDVRVLEFCVRIPDSQTLDHGWTKAILRRAMARELPNDVRWRVGKEHLGWEFTSALMNKAEGHIRAELEANLEALTGYADTEMARVACLTCFHKGDTAWAEEAYHLLYLGEWLRRHSDRPRRVVLPRLGRTAL